MAKKIIKWVWKVICWPGEKLKIGFGQNNL